MNWQPIATAPRDGTHILACNAASSFGSMHGKPLPPIQTTVHYWPHGEKPGFYTSVNEVEPQLPFNATHWKPLDAPAAERANAPAPAQQLRDCTWCSGRGFYGSPGKRCEWCDGEGEVPVPRTSGAKGADHA